MPWKNRADHSGSAWKAVPKETPAQRLGFLFACSKDCKGLYFVDVQLDNRYDIEIHNWSPI
jgi:hypothetical protein